VGRHADVARGHPDLEQARIGVDECGAAEPLHHPCRQGMRQVQEQIGLDRRVQAQTGGRQVSGEGRVVDRVERQRVGETVAPEV